MTEVAHAALRTTASPEAVWGRLIDGRRWSDWNFAVAWMAIDTGLRAGAYVTIKPVRGRQTAYRIVAAEPAQRFTLALRFGPLARLELNWEIARDGSGAAVRQSVAVGGPWRFLVRARAERTAAALAVDLARLCAAAEAAAVSGARPSTGR